MPLASPRHCAAAVLLLTALTGCGGPGEPDAEKSPPQSREDVARYRCLEENGIALTRSEAGHLRVDKDKMKEPDLLKAQDACKHLLSGEDRQVDEETLASARKTSECIRKNGFPGYPDPDPTTGELEMTPELTKAVKSHDPKLIAAHDTCVGPRDTEGGPVAGG
ncbi:hypothetical protein [Streptomyces sp. NPDC002187]|uniref:hypothetical protein n=1 Tax=Streptomyces sp. NPDC002187 TaxID=3364637 RepID=UPI0036A69821